MPFKTERWATNVLLRHALEPKGFKAAGLCWLELYAAELYAAELNAKFDLLKQVRNLLLYFGPAGCNWQAWNVDTNDRFPKNGAAKEKSQRTWLAGFSNCLILQVKNFTWLPFTNRSKAGKIA